MQYAKYIVGVTDIYHAMTIKQPVADEIAKGELDHILRHKNSRYRGEVLIVSSPSPRGERSGMIVGKAELYDIKMVEGGFLYCLRNMERMIEFPCQKMGAKGEVWKCFYTKGVLMPYPKISLRKWISFLK